MSDRSGGGWDEIYQLPTLFDRLDDEDAVPVVSYLEGFDVDVPTGGVVYHDRGIRVPGFDATFVREPADERDYPAFSVQVNAIGPRSAWAVFDASDTWDAYLLRTADGELAAVAWMSDAEFRTDEAGSFASKQGAVAAGRFSFGVFCHTDREWADHADRIRETDAPAYLQAEDGEIYRPQTQDDFYLYVDSTPEEFRDGGGAPPYLGIRELEISIDA